MKAIKILLLCLLFSSGAQAQLPVYLTDWYSYINTTLINGPANGGTKLYVGRAFDSVAAQAHRYASHKADSAALNDTAFAIRASIVAASPTDTTGLSARIDLRELLSNKVGNMNSPNSNTYITTSGLNTQFGLYTTTSAMNSLFALKMAISDSNTYTGYISKAFYYANLPTPTTYSAGAYLGLSAGAFYLDTGANKAATKTDLLGYYPASNPNGYTSNTGTVTSVSGTANRITSTGGATPVIDISSTFEAAITTQTVTTASYTTSVTISSSVASPMSTVNYAITAQAGALLFNNPANSWANGQILIIRIKDNGTNRALTYGSNFRGGTLTLPSTTTTGQTLSMQFVYNSTDTKFDLVGFVSNY